MKKTLRSTHAFTLIEILIAVLIIAVLVAVAIPQYQKAVYKSRYSSLMPIGKSIAQGNEVYYLANGEYTTEKKELDIDGPSDAMTGTSVDLEDDPEYLSYVRVANTDKVPNARYVVYQQHSAKFADTTMCEAKDESARELCKNLGGEWISDDGTERGWAAYLLSGETRGSMFGKECEESDLELTAECGDGYNQKTRTRTGCDRNEGEWTYSEWDDSKCCKGPQELTGKCEDNYENKTRAVTGCNNGTWTYSDWDESRCCKGPQALTEKCEDNYENKTRTITGCNNGAWTYSAWNEDRCCKEADKVMQRTCESGCGTQTRTVTGCSNGIWSYDNWTGACAPGKPDDVTMSCGDGHTGEVIYTHVCRSYSTGPVWEKQYQSNTCDSAWIGSCSASCNSSGSVTSTRPCRNQVFVSGGCVGNCNGACYNGVFVMPNSGCSVGGIVDACGNGRFVGEGSYCESRYKGYQAASCLNGIYSGQGAHCRSVGTYQTKHTCGNSTFKTGTYCFAGGPNSCSGSSYEGTACCYATSVGYCPTGTPKCSTTKNNNTYEWDGTYW